MLNIIPADRPIRTETLNCLIVGQPGIGKSSIAFTASKPLLLDFDHGAHRAYKRRDSVRITDWAEVALLTPEDFERFDTICIDTVGRCLDTITQHLIRTQPKLARSSGELSLQGFGALKAVFVSWLKQVRAQGKDIVMLAHDAEEKDGDDTRVRPDIQGGSRTEIVKVADLVGFLHLEAGKRILDFSPSDRWIGKNCAAFEPLIVPHFSSDPNYLATVLARAKAALNAETEAAIEGQTILEYWADHMKLVNTVDDANATLALIVKTAATLGTRGKTIKGLLQTRVRELGFTYDTKAAKFVAAPLAVE